MNAHLIRQEFLASLRFLALLALGILLFGVMMTAVYPSVKDSFDTMMKTVPSFLKPLVQTRSGFNTFEGFIAVAFTHPVILALLASWSISRGAQAIAGEIERGTLGWMLSYPIGRTSFILSKALVLLVGNLLLALVFILGLWGALTAFRIPHAGMSPYFQAAIATFLLYGAIGAVTLWSSAASSERGKASLVGSGLLLGSFLLNYVAQLWEPLKPMRFLSLFAYYDPKALLYGNAIEPRDVLVLGGVLLVSLVGATVTFRRRNLAI